jgi:hypothetical protein
MPRTFLNAPGPTMLPAASKPSCQNFAEPPARRIAGFAIVDRRVKIVELRPIGRRHALPRPPRLQLAGRIGRFSRDVERRAIPRRRSLPRPMRRLVLFAQPKRRAFLSTPSRSPSIGLRPLEPLRRYRRDDSASSSSGCGPMPRIVVEDHSELIWRGSTIDILIDGIERARLRRNVHADFVVGAGRHSIQARSNGALSRPLSFAALDRESISFDCLCAGLLKRALVVRQIASQRHRDRFAI